MTDTQRHYKRTEVYASVPESGQKPKHLFKVLGDRIEHLGLQEANKSLLDVGGAAGDFVRFLGTRFPNTSLTCLDADPELIDLGRSRNQNCAFVHGDAECMSVFEDGQFSAVTFIGALSIFDDYRKVLDECLRVTAPGGALLVVAQFNEYPVDALIRWRYSDDRGPYNSGYNLFSKATISQYLRENSMVSSFDWERFVPPFEISPGEDPIRSWTDVDGRGERILRNGLLAEINLQILTIRISEAIDPEA